MTSLKYDDDVYNKEGNCIGTYKSYAHSLAKLGYINPLETYHVAAPPPYLDRINYCRNDRWAKTIRDMIAYIEERKIFRVVIGANGTAYSYIIGKDVEFRYETESSYPYLIYAWVIKDLTDCKPDKRVGIKLRDLEKLSSLAYHDLQFLKEWLAEQASPTDTFDWK